MQLPITVDYIDYDLGDVFKYGNNNTVMKLNSIDSLGNIYLKNELGELKFRFHLDDFIMNIKSKNLRLFGYHPNDHKSSMCHHVWKFERFFSNKTYITCSKCGFHKN